MLLTSAPGDAADMYGTAIGTDGDTLRIDGTRVRIFGIDAPEGKQSCERDGGLAAPSRLSSIVGTMFPIAMWAL